MKSGFERAAEIYQARAAYRVEMFLYSALPCAILGLGILIVSEFQPVFSVVMMFIKSLGDME